MIASGPAPERVSRADLEHMFKALKQRGYQLVGPAVRNNAIVYDALDAVDDLPVGWTDVHEAGSYRIKRRHDNALFGYNLGPHSWKNYLFPPRKRLWSGRKQPDGSFETTDESEPTPRFAFIGVRACELHAIQIQDKVFQGGNHREPIYADRRNDNFIVAVNILLFTNFRLNRNSY